MPLVKGPVVSIVGARPQFVKAAIVSEQLRHFGLTEVMIHTGQHYDSNLSDVFFDALGLAVPKYNLGIGGGTHAEMTGRQLIEIEKCLVAEKPRVVVVYGDTNSTLAGALAAVKLHFPVAHVEAGLRSFNEWMPEEINRLVTDRISALLFTPSDVATANLQREGVPAARIVQVGDVMFDAALRYFSPDVQRSSQGWSCVVTIHRAENTDDVDRLRTIACALQKIGRRGRVTFPMHPRTRAVLQRVGLLDDVSSAVDVVAPVGYVEMLATIGQANVVITDSGGLQKEAYFVGTPCVTLRGETEWTETVDLGWNRLVPNLTVDAIVRAVDEACPPPSSDTKPYGSGRAGELIARELNRRY
jgi:UDP-GlcNAc3NAcA epimerase